MIKLLVVEKVFSQNNTALLLTLGIACPLCCGFAVTL